MELFLSPEERNSHLAKNWLDEIYSRDVYLIRRFAYSPLRFEFLIEFFNPEKPNSKCMFSFQKVTSFQDIIHDAEVFEETNGYDEIEDPLDFLESKRDGITEYFIITNVRELYWRTNEVPTIEFL